MIKNSIKYPYNDDEQLFFLSKVSDNDMETIKEIYRKNPKIVDGIIYNCNNNEYVDVCKKLSRKNYIYFSGESLELFGLSFVLASYNNNLEMMEKLVEWKPRLQFSLLNNAALNIACKNGNLEIVKRILEWAPYINVRNYGEMAYRLACISRNIELIDFLLVWDPTINQGIYSEEAFSVACAYGDVEVVKHLYKIRSNLNLSFMDEYFFRRTIEEGHYELANLMIQWRPKKLISWISQNKSLSEDRKIKLLRPYMLKIKLARSIQNARYNPNCQLGKLYLERFLKKTDSEGINQ